MIDSKVRVGTDWLAHVTVPNQTKRVQYIIFIRRFVSVGCSLKAQWIWNFVLPLQRKMRKENS